MRPRRIPGLPDCPECNATVEELVHIAPGIAAAKPCGCVFAPGEFFADELLEADHERELVTDGGQCTASADRPAVCVGTLDYDGVETHNDAIEGEVTRHYYTCPSCGHPISTWMDCPECLWYDEDVWSRTLAEGGDGR